MYFVYILKCCGDLLYTGITTDVERRFREHSGDVKGAKFTRSHPPDSIEALWSCENRSLASKLEYAIKKLNKQQKLRLISGIPEIPEIKDQEKYKRENIQINFQKFV